MEGEHRVTIKKDGYGDLTQTISIAEGNTADVDGILAHSTDVTLRTNNPIATIYIDGENRGIITSTYNLSYGEHKIELKADGYNDFITSINVSQTNYEFMLKMAFEWDKYDYIPPKVSQELRSVVDDFLVTLSENPADTTVMIAMQRNYKIRNSNEQLVAIGYEFLDNNLFAQAIDIAKYIQNIDANYLPALYLEGDAWFKMANPKAYGLAAAKYMQIQSIIPDSITPYLKMVRVYHKISPDYAIELLEELHNRNQSIDVELLYNLLDNISDNTSNKSVEEKQIFKENEVDQPAGFPGGHGAYIAFLNKNLKYPPSALEEDVTGTVRVRFIVSKDGTISSVSGSGADSRLVKEAVRVVKMVPRWQPARKNGAPVDAHLSVPVEFDID